MHFFLLVIALFAIFSVGSAAKFVLCTEAEKTQMHCPYKMRCYSRVEGSSRSTRCGTPDSVKYILG